MYQNDVFDPDLRRGLRCGGVQTDARKRSGEHGNHAKILHGIPPMAVS
jgi:hypothetical protein